MRWICSAGTCGGSYHPFFGPVVELSQRMASQTPYINRHEKSFSTISYIHHRLVARDLMKITSITAHFALGLPNCFHLIFFCIFFACGSCSFVSSVVPVVLWAVRSLREQGSDRMLPWQAAHSWATLHPVRCSCFAVTPELILDQLCGPCSQCCHPAPHSACTAPAPLWQGLPESPCKADLSPQPSNGRKGGNHTL